MHGKWLLAALLVLVNCGCALAGMVDVFLRLDGIQGECADVRHRNEIVVVSWEHAMPREAAAATPVLRLGARIVPAGAVAGAAAQSPSLTFTKRVDTSSPTLAAAQVSQQKIPLAVLVVRRAGTTQLEFLKLTMHDVVISTYSISCATASDAIPTETVGLSFSSIDWEYTPQKADGSAGTPVQATYNPK